MPDPPSVVTTISTAPAAWAGVVAVIDVALFTVTPVAAAPPIVTPVAPVKSLPVMVTGVPPAVMPALGEIAVTVGLGADAAAQLIVTVVVPLLDPDQG